MRLLHAVKHSARKFKLGARNTAVTEHSSHREHVGQAAAGLDVDIAFGSGCRILIDPEHKQTLAQGFSYRVLEKALGRTQGGRVVPEAPHLVALPGQQVSLARFLSAHYCTQIRLFLKY